MHRRRTLLLSAVLVAVAFAGCADNGGNTTTTSPPTTSTPVSGTQPTTGGGGDITVGTTDTITSLDPGNAYEYLSINILQMTMGNLVVNEPDSPELLPELATAMPDISDDGLNYSFTLKSGLKYNDGTPIKASDFKWALERNAGDVAGDEGGPAFLIYDSPGVAGVTADDASGKLTITLKQPGVFFNSLLVFPNFAPIPPEKYTTAGWREPTGTTQNLPVGSGPYQISEYRQGEFVKLTKNPNYDGPRAGKANSITVKFFATSASMKSAIQNGEIDVAFHTFTPDEWLDLVNRGGAVKTLEQPGPSPARYLSFNVNKTGSGMEKKEVRQAFAYAIDRDEINTVVFSDTVTPLYSIVVPGLLGQKDSYKELYGDDPDLERAKGLLESAGYSTSNKLKVDLWFNSDGHYGDTEDELATIIKSQIEKTGMVEITLQSKPWAEYKNDFRAGNYALFLLGWFPDYLDTDDYISPFLTKGGAAAFGTFYDNPDLQPKIKAEQAEEDEAARVEILEEIQDIAADDNPMLPIFSGKQQVAYRDNVKGVTLSPTSIFPYYTLSK